MQKGEMRKWPVLLVAGLMIMGAFIVAIPTTAQAGGGWPILLAQAPVGNYRLDLNMQWAIGPQDIASMAILGVNNTAEIQNYSGPGGSVIIPTYVQYPGEGNGGAGGNGGDGGAIVEGPPSSNFIRVSSIGAEAFKGHTDITSITIPEGVESIGASAFSGCTNLANIFFLGPVMPTVSEQWLNGAPTGMSGLANYCPEISFTGTDYHGLMVRRGVMGGLMKPPAPLCGSIVDSNGQPVVGAFLTIENSTYNGTTDADGNFLLMAPVGLNSVIITGANLKTTTVLTYVGSSGTVMGQLPVSLAGSSKTFDMEGVGLMIVVIALAMALLVVSMLAGSRKKGKK